MADAIRNRGVDIEILVPGRHAVPFFTRRCSRRRYGDLLLAGAKIFEYHAAMMHAKTLVVDSTWSVFGSTNFDPRSFGINDEINVAVCDPELAESLEVRFDEGPRAVDSHLIRRVAEAPVLGAFNRTA